MRHGLRQTRIDVVSMFVNSTPVSTAERTASCGKRPTLTICANTSKAITPKTEKKSLRTIAAVRLKIDRSEMLTSCRGKKLKRDEIALFSQRVGGLHVNTPLAALTPSTSSTPSAPNLKITASCAFESSTDGNLKSTTLSQSLGAAPTVSKIFNLSAADATRARGHSRPTSAQLFGGAGPQNSEAA